MLPLPEHEQVPKKLQDDGNSGLWFERFFNQFNDDASEVFQSKEVNGKLVQGNNFWLQKFGKAGNTEALNLAAKQQLKLVKDLSGESQTFDTEWHFVTGTGYPHPVGNGLAWHHTYGVPYLSGTAVKGLVRAWIEEWEFADIADETERDAKKRECLFSWFGSDDKAPKEQQKTSQAGNVIFFDALPVEQVELCTDIMTPHGGDWYSKGGDITNIATQPDRIPADWHDPNPIPFLVVKKASYLFSVALRNPNVEGLEIKEVMACLTKALEYLGAGAKTATGYGAFVAKDHPLLKEWKKATQSFEDELEAMTEIQLIDAFSKGYNATRARFEQNWQQVIMLIWQYHENTINQWANSNDKNPKKAYKKLIEDRKQ